MEKIISITEVDNYKDETEGYHRFGNCYEGFIVKTDERTIKCLISNEQNCCETSGYLTSEDDLDNYIGADLLSVQSVSGENFDKKLLENVARHVTIEDCMFLEFTTSKGSFQLVVYNEHNGYYSHKVIFDQEELYL